MARDPRDFAPLESDQPSAEPKRSIGGRLGGMAATAAISAVVASVAGPIINVVGAKLPDLSLDTLLPPSSAVAPEPLYVYLAPGEKAPAGAQVMTLDPQVVVGAPVPGQVVLVPQQRQTIYIYLKPGETPPPGAIVQQAGSVTPTPAPVSTAKPPTGGSTPAPTPKPPAATPAPTPKPVPPPTTKPSGAP